MAKHPIEKGKLVKSYKKHKGRLAPVWPLISLALAAGMPGLAQAQSPALSTAIDSVLSQAVALTQDGRPAEAYKLLAPLTKSRAGDPDFDYARGLAAADSGRPAEAILAFQRVLARQPGNGRARAELARAYAMAGDVDTARREFDTVVGDPTIPDPVRQRVTSIISSLDRNIAGGGSSLTGYFEAGVGYDSNINTATAETSLVIPLFAGLGPATLSGSATEADDVYGQLVGGISVQHGFDRQNRVFGSLLGSAKMNSDTSVFDTGTLTGTAGWAHSFADRSVGSLSVQALGFWLDTEQYRTSVGGTAQYTTAFHGGALSASVQYFDLRYPGDALRDGERLAVGLTFASRTGVIALQYGGERVANPAGRHFANDFGGVSLALEYPIWREVTAVSTVSGEIRNYGAADPLFLVRRDDGQIDASFGLRIPLAAAGRAKLTLRPQLTYTKNNSNIALYEYDRVTASVSVRAEF